MSDLNRQGPISVYVADRISFRAADLPDWALKYVLEALTIPNIERQKAMEQHLWGWEQMPKEIKLWRDATVDGETWLSLPRGFFDQFCDGLDAVGFDPIIICDDRFYLELEKIGTPIDLRPWQMPAAAEIVGRKQGIYEAPAGSGKTVTILAVIRELATPSLVIVNTKDILWQWQARAAQFLGEDFPVGTIGDNKVEISEYLTIATAQTLHSRFEEFEEMGFFDNFFGFVCLDECHHSTAETYNRILDRFTARYRVGVSATPDKTGDFALATNVLGPIIHKTLPRDVDTLIRPEIIKVATTFKFAYRRTKNRYQRNNYGPMLQALITNEARNELIASIIKKEEGHHGLCISKRIEHLDILESLVAESDFEGHILRLTGNESRDERKRVVEIANSEPCIIFSTLADEALDVPRLDRGFLVFPQRNAGLITQQVGRFERVHPDKEDSLIYDFADLRVDPLAAQFRIRRFEVYEPRGYKITQKKAEDFAR